MKERLKAGALKDSAKNKDVNGGCGPTVKEEIKEEKGGHSGGVGGVSTSVDIKPPSTGTPDLKPPSLGSCSLDIKPPSNKMANGEAGIKEENGGPMSVGSDANKKSPAGAGGMGTPGAPVGAAGPAPCRPELSAPGFIQQQSQIFVFNSAMANQAAESVKMGKCKSIIGYHVEQHSSQQAINNQRAQQQGKAGGRTPTYPGFGGKPGSMAGEMGGPMGMPPNSLGMGQVEQWVQEQNALQQQQQAMSGMPSYPMTSSAMGGPGQPPNSMYPQGMMGGPMGGPPGGFPMMDSSYEFNPDAVGPGGSVSMPHINLSQNKVPNENLTPEQLKNRSEKLRGLSKIKGSLEMRGLLDSGGPGHPGHPEMYMGPGGQPPPGMMGQPMMQQHMMGMGQGGPPGMMSPSQQYMMGQGPPHMPMDFPPGHPGFRQGMGPGMGADINAHQAWLRMQQEYYETKSKQRSQQMMGGPMGPGGPMQHPMSGPPPPYYSTMGAGAGKRGQPVPPMGMVGSPTPPSPMLEAGVDPLMFPSARSRGMPMDPQAMEAMGPGYGPGPGMPPHSMGMMMPGMEGPLMPGMGAQGPPMVSGPMMGGRVGASPMMGCSSSGVNVVSSSGGRKASQAGAPQVTLQRAGNPEQFMPEPNPAGITTSGSKPPPSYAQAQKRKRDDMDDPFKNLQPTPSPTPLHYLSSFEGQELTITKQLNSAFRDGTPNTCSGGPGGGLPPHDTAAPAPSSAPLHNAANNQFSSPASNSNPVNSPMPHTSSNTTGAGNPPSVKNPMSNSSQTSSAGHLGSPGGLQHPPGQSPLSGANMRLSHYDPSTNPTPNAPANGMGPNSNSNSMNSAPPTPTAVVPKQQQQQQQQKAPPSQGMTPAQTMSSQGMTPAQTMSSQGMTPAQTMSSQLTQGMTPAQTMSSQLTQGMTPAQTMSSQLTQGMTPAQTMSGQGMTPAQTMSSQGMSPAQTMSSQGMPPSQGMGPSQGMPLQGMSASSSSMSNITSATLANLAKGVENLSNQMQQSMVHGGPFHSIQVQGQVGASSAPPQPNNPQPSNNSVTTPTTSTSVSQSTAPPPVSQAQANTSSQQQQQPSSASSTPKQYINNTNISQVNNFYGVNHREASQASMEVHSMSMEGSGPHTVSMTGAGSSGAAMSGQVNGSMGPAGPPAQMHQQQHQQQHQQMMMAAAGGGGGSMGVSMAMSQAQMQQQQSVGGSIPPPVSGPPMASMQPGMPPSSSQQVKSPPYPHPLPMPSMSTGMQGGAPPGATRLTSPPFPPNSSLGNANVHIQPKAPNTIQYLPANPPPTQQPPMSQPSPMGAGGPPQAKRAATEMEMMARYSSPMDMKGSHPSSTLQYFPQSPPNHSLRSHPGAGGPPPPPHPGAMPEFTPQQTMEMQQAMMMRGGVGPQDYMMGGSMPPHMMGPGGPSMHSPLGMERMDMGGMGSPMDPVMMGPGASAMRHATVMGPGGGGGGGMDPMTSPMPSMMGPSPSNPPQAYPSASPQGYLPNGQSMMMQPMQGHPMSQMSRMPGPSPGAMPRMPMGGGAAGGGGGYSAQYQQFQQQLYAQGRPRQMSPHMMGGGPSGPPQAYMGMIPPNMPGPS